MLYYIYYPQSSRESELITLLKTSFMTHTIGNYDIERISRLLSPVACIVIGRPVQMCMILADILQA